MVTIKYGNILPYSNKIWQSNSQQYGNRLPYTVLYGKLPYTYTIWLRINMVTGYQIVRKYGNPIKIYGNFSPPV